MKKFFVIVLLLFLTGCTENSFESKLNQLKLDIATEMGSTANFSVEEEFTFKQYGVNNEQPHNKIVSINNVIEYDNNVIYTENDMSFETNYLGEETRGYYTFDSYKDLINNEGYIKPENEWYAVGLTKMYTLGMGSFDPVSVVNAILYNNDEITFRGEDQITVEPEEYRIAVAEISSDVFEELFGSTIFRFLSVEYEYSVIVTMKFNESNQIEYMEFDLRELLQQVSDYSRYELKSEVNSIYGTYHLTFNGYNEVVIEPVVNSIDWELDNDYQIEATNEVIPEISIGSSKAEVVYSDEDENFKTTVSFETTEDLGYLYYEIYYYRNGELLKSYYSEYYDLFEFENVVLHIYSSETDVDEVEVFVRYMKASSSDVFFESGYSDVSVEGPIHSVDIDRADYNQKATELVPTVLVEPVGIVGGVESYNVYIDLYAVEDTRNGFLKVYLVENEIIREVIQLDDFNMKQFEQDRIEKTVNFKPDEVLIDISYKTSYLWLNQQKLNLTIHEISNPMTFIEVENGVSVTAYEIDDRKWYADKYLLSFNLNNDVDVLDCYVYFVDEDGIVIGWEHIVDFDVNENYEVVSDLYQEDVEDIYIEIDADGVHYSVIAITGILVQ